MVCSICLGHAHVMQQINRPMLHGAEQPASSQSRNTHTYVSYAHVDQNSNPPPLAYLLLPCCLPCVLLTDLVPHQSDAPKSNSLLATLIPHAETHTPPPSPRPACHASNKLASLAIAFVIHNGAHKKYRLQQPKRRPPCQSVLRLLRDIYIIRVMSV